MATVQEILDATYTPPSTPFYTMNTSQINAYFDALNLCTPEEQEIYSLTPNDDGTYTLPNGLIIYVDWANSSTEETE